jgi:aminoglycoside phosphotransferase (APT) family kinase protein
VRGFEHPFVDRPISDPRAAERAAVAVAERFGLGVPEPLRRGMNASFVAGEVVLRVGHATAPPELAHELAVVVAAHGVRTAEPAPGVVATVDGLAVTGWRRLQLLAAPVDWTSVGSMVRRLHELRIDEVPAGYPVPEPSVFAWWDFDALLVDVGDDIDLPARDGLRAAVERHRGWEDRVRSRAVVCHGDVHPGNVVMTADGPCLLDWDLLCHAGPAWDHAMLTSLAERWGGDPGVYPAFAAGYGRSFADDALARSLGELRNVAATLMRVRAGRSDPAAAAEAERRLRYWRGDPDAPSWHAQ